MRRFYQESWQGVPFTSFTNISFFNVADAKFYATFYEELFRRHESWDTLPEQWCKGKKLDAQWLIERIKEQAQIKCATEDHEQKEDNTLNVLSIGSGVGYMEKIILENLPHIALHVNEPSTISMQWLRQYIPNQRIYIGMPPACLPSDIKYDIIYLSAVDYSITQQDLIRLLSRLKEQLSPNGKLFCLSSSLLEEENFAASFVNSVKIFLRAILKFLDVRRQQFWGWRRTRKEYNNLFASAGFNNIDDGFIDKDEMRYWISGYI